LPVSVVTSITIYVAGVEYSIPVSITDTAATLATAMAAEFADNTNAPFAVVDAAGVLTLTANHSGEAGNSIDIRSDLYGDESSLSAGVVSTAFTGGAGNPDVTNGLAALGDADFLWIVSAYTDAANLTLLTSFMNDTSGRWSPFQQAYGHVVAAHKATVAALSLLGSTLNDKHLSIIGYNASASPSWAWAAALGAKVSLHLSDAPELSRPLQFITLEGIIAPKIQDRFGVTDRNTLLFDGIGTYRVTRDGAVQIERAITTYLTDPAGASDQVFLDIQTLAQSQYTLRYLRNKVLQRHGRQALAENDASPITGVTRPRDVKATLVAGYAELAALGVVERQEVFESNLIVERNLIDPNRLDVYLPFDVINQLRVLAVQAAAFLAYPTEIAG